MNKIITCILLMCVISINNIWGQIGVYTESPHQSSALHIESTNKGFLLPRMTTAQKNAISNPANGLMVFDTDQNCISIWIAVDNQWTCTQGLNHQYFFYMPSINVPVRDASGVMFPSGVNQTLNLYDEYKAQFDNPNGRSDAANIPTYSNASQLNYYVTYADPAIDIQSIDDLGILSYRVVGGPSYDSYVNIIFTIR